MSHNFRPGARRECAIRRRASSACRGERRASALIPDYHVALQVYSTQSICVCLKADTRFSIHTVRCFKVWKSLEAGTVLIQGGIPHVLHPCLGKHLAYSFGQ